MKSNIFISIVVLSLFASCSTTLDFSQPGTRFIIPETSGDTLKGDVKIGYGTGTDITVGTVYDDTIFNTGSSVEETPAIDRSESLSLLANLGVINKVDLTVESSTDTPTIYGIKVQVLGNHRGADKGYKLSFGGGYGSGQEDDSYISTSNSVNVTAKMDIDVFDLYTSFGYRGNKSVLYYSTLIYTKYMTDSILDTSTIEPLTLKQNAEILAINLGTQLTTDDGTRAVIFEAGAMKTNWAGAHKWSYPLGVAFIYMW